MALLLGRTAFWTLIFFTFPALIFVFHFDESQEIPAVFTFLSLFASLAFGLVMALLQHLRDRLSGIEKQIQTLYTALGVRDKNEHKSDEEAVGESHLLT